MLSSCRTEENARAGARDISRSFPADTLIVFRLKNWFFRKFAELPYGVDRVGKSHDADWEPIAYFKNGRELAREVA